MKRFAQTSSETQIMTLACLEALLATNATNVMRTVPASGVLAVEDVMGLRAVRIIPDDETDDSSYSG